MTLEDRPWQMVSALPDEASIMLPVAVVRGWLDEEGDDPLNDYTVAEVAAKLRRSEGGPFDLRALDARCRWNTRRSLLRQLYVHSHNVDPHNDRIVIEG